MPKFNLHPDITTHQCLKNPITPDTKCLNLGLLPSVVTLEVDTNRENKYSSPIDYLNAFGESHPEFLFSEEPLYFALGECQTYGNTDTKDDYYNRYETRNFFVFNNLIIRREGPDIYENRNYSSEDSITFYEIDKKKKTIRVMWEQLVGNELSRTMKGLFLNMLPIWNTGSEYTGGLFSYYTRTEHIKRHPKNLHVRAKLSEDEADFYEIAYEFRNGILNYLKDPSLEKMQHVEMLIAYFQKSKYGELLMAGNIAKSLDNDALTHCLSGEVKKQFAGFNQFLKDKTLIPPPVYIHTLTELLKLTNDKTSRTYYILKEILEEIEKNMKVSKPEKELSKKEEILPESKEAKNFQSFENNKVNNLFGKTREFITFLTTSQTQGNKKVSVVPQ